MDRPRRDPRTFSLQAAMAVFAVSVLIMNKAFHRIFISLVAVMVLLPAKLTSADTIGNVLAVVGNIPITDIDLAEEVDFFRKRKGIKKDKRNIDSQVLDLLISRAVVDFIAFQESISISKERVDNHIAKQMEQSNVTSEAQFARIIKQQYNLTMPEFKRETRRRLKTQQVVQLRVSVPNPTPSQIREWYRLRGKKVFGNKYLVRIIRVKFRNGDTKDELRASKIARQAYSMARRNFAAAAKKYSDHYSSKRGGLLGWQRLDEVVKIDPLVAGATQNIRPGRVSTRFRSNGAYYIVKVDASKPLDLDEVYDFIRARLYAENEEAAFAQWVQEQRQRISVEIHMKDYQEL